MTADTPDPASARPCGSAPGAEVCEEGWLAGHAGSPRGRTFFLRHPLPQGPLLPRAAVWIPIHRIALLRVRFIGDVVQVHGRLAADLKAQPAELPRRMPRQPRATSR